MGLYALFALLFLLESRVSLLLAMVMFAFCPLFFATNNIVPFQILSVNAFYLLCIGICIKLFQQAFYKNPLHGQ